MADTVATKICRAHDLFPADVLAMFAGKLVLFYCKFARQKVCDFNKLQRLTYALAYFCCELAREKDG